MGVLRRLAPETKEAAPRAYVVAPAGELQLFVFETQGSHAIALGNFDAA
jgi:hypothetical protein